MQNMIKNKEDWQFEIYWEPDVQAAISLLLYWFVKAMVLFSLFFLKK